jgi:hypothetical protein
MLKRLATALALLVLCALSMLRVVRPAAPVPATSPDTVFSAERAMRHVEQIAQRPHGMGTADHERVRDYIVTQLTQLGLRPQIQRTTGVGTRYQQAGRVANVLAWMPGSDPKGKALLLMVHYDGVGAGPAAADDGAGVAALLETLRALTARKAPLAHDVIALFTDGEETGLLGAAAFVREHPWAKDVAMVLNFEARGTAGRSFMFETGPGNLDAARVLRRAGNVSAGSVFTAVYRVLPNDTDLSEFAALGVPALNFAFTDGVERYHTTHDDIAHLSAGSLQEHGTHMLALTRIIASEPLPRVQTGDAAFFDVPLIGLVVYPVWLALPFAALALVLVVLTIRRVDNARSVVVGAAAAILSVCSAALVASVMGSVLAGPAIWNSVYALALALVAVALTVAICRFALRWSDADGMHAGALVIWLALALTVSAVAPAVSYLLVWPLLFTAGASLLTRGRETGEWIAAAVALFVLAGFTYGASVIMLGLTGPGAIALGTVTSLITLLLLPQVRTVSGATKWGGAHWLLIGAVVLTLVGLVAVRPSAAHPVRTAILYAENADSSDAWLLTAAGTTNDWAKTAVGAMNAAPTWTQELSARASRYGGRAVQRVPLEAPNAAFVRDTVINGARRVVIRLTAPKGTTALLMRARGAPVLTASIDGRVIDTTRYRVRSRDWIMQFSAVPDSGAVLALSIPLGVHIELGVAARRPGLPVIPGVTIAPRPEFVVPSQDGDVTVVYRVFRF